MNNYRFGADVGFSGSLGLVANVAFSFKSALGAATLSTTDTFGKGDSHLLQKNVTEPFVL